MSSSRPVTRPEEIYIIKLDGEDCTDVILDASNRIVPIYVDLEYGATDLIIGPRPLDIKVGR